MNFPRFAFNNVRRNSRAYMAYFLSSAFMVMIFFCFAVFVNHPEVEQIQLGKLSQAVMKIAEYVIFVFAVFFVLYSISQFLKNRRREFGLLLILGARPGQINRLIFIENMLIGMAAIVSGVASGLILSKMFLLFGTKMMEVQELPFYWPTGAIKITVISFLALFICISVFTLSMIKKSQALQLLKGGSAAVKKEPKVSWVWSFLGAVLLGIGWYALYMGRLTPVKLFIAAAAGIAGTYLFYSQISVLLIGWIKKRRTWVWKKVNLLWVSEMAYKLKDNARMLFLVTVVISIASMSAGVVIAMDEDNRDSYLDDPFVLRYYSTNESFVKEDLDHINRQLEAAGVVYNQFKVESINKSSSHRSLKYLSVMPLSIFNQIENAIGLNSIPLDSKHGQALLVYDAAKSSPVNVDKPIEIVLEGGKQVQIQGSVGSKALPYMGYINTNLLIVSDDLYKQLRAQEQRADTVYFYEVPAWNSGSLPDEASQEYRLGVDIGKWNEDHDHGNLLSIRSDGYIKLKLGTALFRFIGIFISLIFSFASASFLYFKLHTELSTDAAMYRALSKIGLSTAEMKKSTSLQIGLLFFIPIIVSTIFSLVVLAPILKMVYINSYYKPVLMAAAGFLALQMVYYFIVRAGYLRHLKRIMV
ncbi:ABC transporter permease [Paenibacillus sp. CAA11]|uniref:FtsX-like permease family protein n=1 Tax=Paenibacillus sp. CAA11 TaxID=1532905 RepID=UPI000D38BC74|nr:ABC transporter permease [Paenibacillus sp. CAA11]AWB44577.1 ABC transporter permease [Paenibacillus sp. CAA11]